MKKLLLLLALLLPGTAGATSLANTSGLAPSTDTVYDAVVKVNTEIDRIYTFINSLFKLQAAATCPAAGNSSYDVCIDTDTPQLNYWDGNSWEPLVNPTAYSSGLTFNAAVKGYTENCNLTTSTTFVQLVSTTRKPCTLELDGALLQVTGTISEQYSAVGAGTYFVKPVLSGTTFTLSHDNSDDGTTHYLGVVTLSDTGVISGLYSYESYDQLIAQPMVGAFCAKTPGILTIGTDATVLFNFTDPCTVNGIPLGGFDLGTDKWTPTRKGWYELNVSSAVVAATHCVLIKKNGTDLLAANCGNSSLGGAGWAGAAAKVYMNGSTDYLTLHVYAGGSSSTPDFSSYTSYLVNAMWGRWIGTAAP